MLQTQPLEFADFSGGIADNYIDCPLNQYQEADNFLVNRNRKLFLRNGSSLLDLDDPQTPEGQFRIGNYISFKGHLLVQVRKNFYVKTLTGWDLLTGPSGNAVLNEGLESDSVIYTEWNDQLLVSNVKFALPTRLYIDENDDFQVRTAGLPVVASNPTITGTAGTKNYIYAFVRKYSYTVGTVQFEEVSEPLLVEKLLINEPSTNTVAITAIPILTNTLTTNYDTSEIKIEIYRTEDAGTTLYYVGEITNGTTTYNDTTSDVTLLTSSPIYTDGGVFAYEAPPLAKFVHVVGDVALYGFIKEGTQLIQDRILMSVPGNPAAVPRLFFQELGQEITGISSVENTPVVFCKKSVYRIDGIFDSLGNGDVTKQRISSTVGCVSAHSIVQVQGGCFFAGNDGFYFTDGFNVRKVSANWNTRYATYVENDIQAARIHGTYNKTDQRIWWAVSSNAGVAENNDKMFILDLNFGMSDSMCFTTASNGTHFAPTAITFHEGVLIRGDHRGYTFQHTASDRSDPKVELAVDPSEWDIETIVYNYLGPATSFGTNQVRKWVTKISVEAKNESNLNLQITSINDDLKSTEDLSIIRFAGSLTWGDPDLTWGDQTLEWNSQGMLSAIRHFPKHTLRCSLKQIQITNGLGYAINSDTAGLVDIDATIGVATGTATLTGSTWPLYSRDYFMYFENDGYVKGFPVTVRTSDTVLTLTNLDNELVAGAQRFILKGKLKNEVLGLLSYTIHYAPLTASQKPYETAQSGANET